MNIDKNIFENFSTIVKLSFDTLIEKKCLSLLLTNENECEFRVKKIVNWCRLEKFRLSEFWCYEQSQQIFSSKLFYQNNFSIEKSMEKRSEVYRFRNESLKKQQGEYKKYLMEVSESQVSDARKRSQRYSQQKTVYNGSFQLRPWGRYKSSFSLNIDKKKIKRFSFLFLDFQGSSAKDTFKCFFLQTFLLL